LAEQSVVGHGEGRRVQACADRRQRALHSPRGAIGPRAWPGPTRPLRPSPRDGGSPRPASRVRGALRGGRQRAASGGRPRRARAPPDEGAPPDRARAAPPRAVARSARSSAGSKACCGAFRFGSARRRGRARAARGRAGFPRASSRGQVASQPTTAASTCRAG
jgi:hypothetical protein